MNSTRQAIVLSALIVLACSSARAEFVGLDIGASQWSASLSGAFQGSSDESIDLVDDLDVEDSSQSSMVLILEHPIQALPNLRYQGFDLDSSVPSAFDSDVNFIGQTFRSADQPDSSFDLSHEEIVLYYQLVDNWVDLDLGVDLKLFDGEISVGGEQSATVEVDETIPLLYLSARFDLPKTGFYVGASINANLVDLGLSESEAQDSTILLGYESRRGLGIEGGYKYFSLDLDDVNELDTDFEYDGIFFNGYYNF
ncbi:MAG: TIGR04219 family outer membrane beta-barrel protein [Gammaproteobacteria bacterium]|nr:TIGR04219 family outer membrane beta-barrel protein [Gammaproteobacteria bacterium]